MTNCRNFAVLLLAVIAGAMAFPAHAQTSGAPALLQKEYNQFIARFRGALKANDPAAVTAMTRFPYFWNQRRDAVFFQKNIYSKLFTRSVRSCIARSKGVYDRDQEGNDNYFIFCGEQIFVFTRTPDGFRFAETGMND